MLDSAGACAESRHSQTRGFAELAETSAPEELMGVLHEYHAAVGSVVAGTDGTVGPLNADELVVF